MKLDTVCFVETPEGTDLHADVAGLVPRALAYSIDLLLRGTIIFALSIVMSIFGKTGQGILFLVYFLLEWWYPVLFEIFRGGQTVGKKALGIKVVNDDLTPVQLGPSLTRNLLRTADFFPLFYATGVLSILFTKRFQRLGDIAANTLVIYQEKSVYDGPALEHIQPIATPALLNEAQQAAFISFSLSHNRLSAARQNEIAEIIRPKLPDNTDSAADYVRGVGKWLLGAK